MTRKSVVSSLLSAGALWALYKGKSRSASQRGHLGARRDERARKAADQAARRYMMYVVMPVWAVSGFLDWLWHRQTKIETTSGVNESIMHVVMMAEAGLPILTGMFLEINAGALALMGAGWLLHEMTVALDVKYTVSRRVIPPREQHTHTYMQTVPFNIVMTFACLYPEQAMALLGLGEEKADFKLRSRKPPIPLKDFAAVIACMGILSGLPHLEELWRCYSAKQKGIAGRDIPECARELYAS